MTSLVAAMDNVNCPPKQSTENGNNSYGWNLKSVTEKDIQENIVQFYFQCVLGESMDVEMMQEKYEELLFQTQNGPYFDYVVKLTLQTRDIDEGKGMNQLSYYMLQSLFYCFYCLEDDEYKNIYNKIVERMVQEFNYQDNTQMPYGSWKDMKKYLNVLFHSRHEMFLSMTKEDVIVNHIDEFYVKHMVQDRKDMSINKPISLLGKWLPRESSKEYKWLAIKIAQRYYFHVYGFVPTKKSIALKEYRKLASKFNKYLDVTQVHMCKRTWDVINFDHVTALTMYKNKDAFMNKKEIKEEHRYICKSNLEEYIEKKVKQEKSMKGKTLLPHQLVKNIIYPNGDMDETNINIINLQWKGLVEHIRKNGNDDNFLNNCISCIDVSPSMYNSEVLPFTSAIGMGLMAMEFSNVKRAFTFSEVPQWIEMDEANSFYEKVKYIQNTHWGATTDIYSMFEMLLQVCLENNVTNEEMAKYSLFIFSDMQFNSCCRENENSIVERIKNLYKSHNYDNIPYLIFWNLRSTNNFPTINKTPYSTKLSGNSASLFKFFTNTTLESIKKMTNWTLIREILNNSRYNLE